MFLASTLCVYASKPNGSAHVREFAAVLMQAFCDNGKGP